MLSTVLTSSKTKIYNSNYYFFLAPSKPILEFLKIGVDDVTFAFLVPKIENPHLSYYVEYFDIDHAPNINFIETNKTALRIRQLEPNTRYKLRIFAIYRGVPSTEPLEKEFKTRGLSNFQNNVARA